MVRVKDCLLFALISAILSFPLPIQAQSQRQDRAKLHFDRARELEVFNDPQAEKEYKLAIEARNGRYSKALLNLGFYLETQLRFSEAALALRDYIKQTPKQDHTGHRERLKDLERAAVLQERIKNTDPPDLSYLLEFASLVNRYGRDHMKQAVPYAEKAVALYPESSEAHLLLGRLLIGSQHQTRRFEVLKKAIELDPTNPRAHHQLGWYFIERLQGKEASEEFRKTLNFSNGSLTDAWQGLGWALSMQGQRKEAIEAFRSYLRESDASDQYRVKIIEQIKKLEQGT